MRYYKIEITDAATGQPIVDAQGNPFGPYSSFLPASPNTPTKGFTLPGALNIEFDLPVTSFTNVISQGYLRMWGIGLSVMGQSSQFNPGVGFTKPAAIKISGGMYPGLPLATAAFNAGQTGLLVDGIIQQAFGNWEGTTQTLDFIIIPNPADATGVGGFGSIEDPRNIVFKWSQGQQLGDAAVAALQTAFPGAVITAQVSTLLTLPYDPQHGFYQTVGQFSDYLNKVSIAVVNDPTGAYQGIRIVPTTTGFALYDGTVTPTGSSSIKSKQIEFTDLVGQPTWINLFQINFKTILRADIAVGDFIKMPNGPQINTAQSYSQYRNRTTFQGVFQVISVRHLGNYRQASGDAWVTVFDAVYVGPVA